jgi:virulence-associated protein VapD
MKYDHNAIRRAYSNCKSIIDSIGVFDESGNSITLDQTKIDAARATLDAEAAAVKYKTDRTTNGSTTYSSVGDQLDLLWHAIDADADLKSKFSAFYNSIKAVKDANPKP